MTTLTLAPVRACTSCGVVLPQHPAGETRCYDCLEREEFGAFCQACWGMGEVAVMTRGGRLRGSRTCPACDGWGYLSVCEEDYG